MYLHGDCRYDGLRNTTPEVAKLDDILRKKMIEKLVLRDVARIGETVSISKSDIEERTNSKSSIMPAERVNALAVDCDGLP